MRWEKMGMRVRTTQRQRLGCLCVHSYSYSYSSLNRNSNRKVTVNKESVHLTLSKCPSDLISLSFFLWSAQHRRHDSVAVDHMITVLRRLTLRYKTFPAILSQLDTIGCGASLANPNSLFLFLRIYSRLNHHLPHTVHILRLMLTTGYSPPPLIFHMLLNSLCNANMLLQASQLLGLMIPLGVKFSVNVWTILIHAFCKLGRLDVATNLFHHMSQTASAPNVVTYTTLIKAFMQSNRVTHALHLFNIMLSAGHIPDLILCNVLIHCLSKVGRYRDAISVFRILSQQNIKPDSYTFTSLLPAIFHSRRFNLLPELVPRLRCIDVDIVFCNALLSSLVKAGFPSRAVAFYAQMINEGFVPDKFSFAGLLSALCSAGTIDEAVNVYRGVLMSHNDTDAHIHTVITSELVKTGKFHKAASLFRLAVRNSYPLDSVAYNVGIYALLRGGRTQEACTLYDQMKDSGLKPNVHTYNMMLFTFCKERDIQMIKRTLQEMVDSRIELSDRNYFNLCKYTWRSDTYLYYLKLLAEMRDLGLLSAKALHGLNFDRDNEGVQPKYKHVESNIEWNLVLDSSSSEDLSDVAASAG
ncbi:hypothetical protein RJT34_10570 [Clitoria ternatea]|uniref:Pentatricopeptide repeat-containing protein n=1 Tax=Clitoria ternatea TaxID=43366 RepID=A0AAN9K6Z6_CLITE